MQALLSGYSQQARLDENDEAIIYRALRESDNLPVLLKIAQPLARLTEYSARYQHDFAFSRELTLPGIFQPLALEHSHGRPMLVFADFGGIPLSLHLQRQACSCEDALRIALQAATILRDLHQHFVLHKHLTSANVFVNPASGELRFTGFDLATRLMREAPIPTPPTGMLDSLAYISPELTGRMNRSVDSRSDLYSLGVVIYECFAGQRPFTSRDPMEVLYSHLAKMPRLLHAIRRDIPPVVSDIVHTLLAKAPEERYQTAAGLRADLETCLRQYRQTGAIPAFPLRQADASKHFRIPEKLYGREAEIQTILAAFERVAAGGRELLLCAGEPGIGKTALIDELQRPVLRQRGYFVQGKHDIFQRNLPYSALLQAFRHLIALLLEEPDAERAMRRTRILERVGRNGRLLLDVLPELEPLIGPQPAVEPLPSHESQNRFQLVFQGFVEAMSVPRHPVVLFLDDLQWADRSTLQMVEVLLGNQELRWFLLLGAYRHTEVHAGHPLAILLDHLRQAGVLTEPIRLAPLSLTATRTLLRETFGESMDEAHVQRLAGLVHAESGGNPFFTRESVANLHQRGIIVFDEGKGWQYAADPKQDAGISRSVVNLIGEKIRNLSPHTWQVLQYAACLGFEFDLSVLAAVCRSTEAQMLDDLHEAFEAGILVKVATEARFVHDKVSEAAHALIAPQDRPRLHYRIAKTLLATPELHDRYLFHLADQLNAAQPLLTEAERARAVSVNRRAADKAHAAAAYDAAANFCSHAAAMLPDTAWDTAYATTLSIYRQWAESAYMAIQFTTAEHLFQVIQQHARTLDDAMPTYAIMLAYYEAHLRFEDAIEFGVRVLNDGGIPFPSPGTIDQALLQRQMARFRRNFGRGAPDERTALPEADDAHAVHMMTFLARLVLPFWASYPAGLAYELLELANLSLERGVCPASVTGFGLLPAVLVDDFEEYELAYHIGEFSLTLQEQIGNAASHAEMLFLFYNHTHYWNMPLRHGHEHLLTAYHECLETGNIQWAAYCLNHYCLRRLLAGDPLDFAKAEYDRYTEALHRLRQKDAIGYFDPPKQLVYNLGGHADEVLRLHSAFFDDDGCLQAYLRDRHYDAAGMVYFCRLWLNCVFGHFQRALAVIAEAGDLLTMVRSQFQTYLAVFLSGLAFLRTIPDGQPEAHAPSLRKARACQAKLRAWAEVCPINFAAMYHLVAAEMARVTGDHWDAVAHYQQAVLAAEEANFPHIAALAHEAAADFWTGRQNRDYTEMHVRAAYQAYQTWGCVPKLRQLEADFPALFPAVRPAVSEPDQLRLDSFDVRMILTASLTLSEEIDLGPLLQQMMRMLLENTGAQRAALVLDQAGQLLLEAFAEPDNEAIAIQVQQHCPLEQAPMIPSDIIRSVFETGHTVLREHADEPAEAQPPRPKSMLCVPLHRQERIIGVLYADNNLASHVFQPKRAALLNILLPQIAISLENARFFAERQRSEEALRQSEERYRAIAESAIDSIFCKDREQRYTFVNPAMETLFGAPASALLGKRPDDVFDASAAAIVHEVDQIALSGRVANAIRDLSIGGEVRTFHTIQTPLRDAEGRITGISGIVRDITEQKRAEEEIRRLNAELEERVQQRTIELEHRNRELQDFAYVVSHDLKAPLRGISRLADWLASDYADVLDEAGANMTELLIGRVQRMDNLIDGILNYSRIGRIEEPVEDLDLSELLDTVVDLLNPPDHIVVAIAPGLPVIRASRTRMTQLFQNLIGNAIKFSDKPRGEISVQCRDKGAYWHFSVSDNGPGIEERFQERIFHMFQTLHPRDQIESTGVGLAVVKKIVELYGGEIGVESKIGEGACFWFTLPKPYSAPGQFHTVSGHPGT